MKKIKEEWTGIPLIKNLLCEKRILEQAQKGRGQAMKTRGRKGESHGKCFQVFVRVCLFVQLSTQGRFTAAF
jgi:hypothetical protein